MCPMPLCEACILYNDCAVLMPKKLFILAREGQWGAFHRLPRQTGGGVEIHDFLVSFRVFLGPQ